MPLLALLLIACQIICGLHVVRSGQERNWLYLIIALPGLGKLKVGERPARTGRNPQTGASIQIAAKKVVKYVPAKALADSLNA